MQEPIDVAERMRSEWNERAREDAHFYVAFGRREQGENEFFETARKKWSTVLKWSCADSRCARTGEPGARSKSDADRAV